MTGINLNTNEASERLAKRLGISRTAAELYLDSRVLDLHVESYSFIVVLVTM